MWKKQKQWNYNFFSGGKDSTVLLDIVLKTHKELKSQTKIVLIYATEITFHTTIKFIKETYQQYKQLYPALKSLEIINPRKTWMEILLENGYPIFLKQISTLLNRVKKIKQKIH